MLRFILTPWPIRLPSLIYGFSDSALLVSLSVLPGSSILKPQCLLRPRNIYSLTALLTRQRAAKGGVIVFCGDTTVTVCHVRMSRSNGWDISRLSDGLKLGESTFLNTLSRLAKVPASEETARYPNRNLPLSRQRDSLSRSGRRPLDAGQIV